jgi:hypothetical protein
MSDLDVADSTYFLKRLVMVWQATFGKAGEVRRLADSTDTFYVMRQKP